MEKLDILDDLISKGRFLEKGIIFQPPPSNVYRTYKVYIHQDNSAYQNWIALCKRFLNEYSKEDLNTFEELSKKILPDNHIKMLSILNSIKEFSQITSKIVLKPTQNTNKVFIVHGHDEKAKIDVARTLEKLGLEAIILHEQADGGKTIIEKFEKNAIDVGFAVILLTADDEGKAKRENDYKDRARQNVVFEMGYFMGKLGRDRVLLLLDKGVDKPGDLDGIVYTPIDEHDAWKYKLVKEMKAVGYSVSADSL
ncbi:TIR domain-containing protein [Dysgonomonas sp. HGC4]|uniref:TIR domain-containing protein n=1 Tax=Dysgonomonas sp. HGC4 TaxID=1658009 RepID=UPI00068158E1|nr:nucleotide-binding protein [Dysgonomonas sp. HGC4]MBD8349768.1 nucleotide-binding protein [Dysgonomonas sp. HGC4]